MGHVAQITGRIAIDPPIPWRQFAEGRFVRPVQAQDLEFEVQETYEDTPEGKLRLYRDAVAIVGQDDEVRGDDIEQELEEIIRLHGEGRTFLGRLNVRWPDFGSDEAPELRFMVVDGRVRRFEAVTVWPPESE
jgi:hypothetical protein